MHGKLLNFQSPTPFCITQWIFHIISYITMSLTSGTPGSEFDQVKPPYRVNLKVALKRRQKTRSNNLFSSICSFLEFCLKNIIVGVRSMSKFLNGCIPATWTLHDVSKRVLHHHSSHLQWWFISAKSYKSLGWKSQALLTFHWNIKMFLSFSNITVMFFLSDRNRILTELKAVSQATYARKAQEWLMYVYWNEVLLLRL